ncbi:hypothetical protein GX411_04075 [Candidatus Fermentibacteria bacterium]|nr:hypothetical protein [Candidatus Fermentibacteria bacterium]
MPVEPRAAYSPLSNPRLLPEVCSLNRIATEISRGLLASFGLPWRMLRDEATGATVLSVQSCDRDFFAGICFRTPAGDSRGIPHVLEHCVLNGSAKYPVRDAFNELWRGSLHSYLNAVTAPDRTLYYIGSPDEGDFHNLLSVYLDLVFDPLLDPVRVSLESFHYVPGVRRGRRLASPSGVVYSEMSGSYSDPDELSAIAIQAAVMPDTPYRHDSGGDPSRMHRLSYEDIVEYHARHYHTGNCLFFVYSPLEAAEALAKVAGLIPPRARQGQGAAAEIPAQRPWGRPRSLRLAVPSGRGGSLSANVSWLLGEVADSRSMAAWQIVEEILLGDSGVLSRVLIDSRYGADISPETGLDMELRQSLLTVGLRGCAESAARLVRGLVFRTLEKFAGGGPPNGSIEAALNVLMTRYSEKSDEFPLKLFTRALRAWTYGTDPGAWMDHAADIRALAAERDLGRRLAGLVREGLLENPHRLNSLIVPSKPSRGASGTPVRDSVFEKLEMEHSRLREYARSADDPGALAKIPRISLDDIDPEAPDLPLREAACSGIPLTLVELPRAGTVHLEVAFDLSVVGSGFQTLVPVAARCLGGMPAGGLSFEELSRRLSSSTGGLDCEPFSFLEGASRRPRAYLILSCSCLSSTVESMTDILETILRRTEMSDEDRFGEIVSEMRIDLESDMVPCCDVFSRLAASAFVGGSAALGDCWEGMPQHNLLEALSGSAEARRDAAGEVGRILSDMIGAGAVRLVAGADPGLLDRVSSAVKTLAGALRHRLDSRYAEPPKSSPGAVVIRWDTSVGSACISGPAPLFAEADAGLCTAGSTLLADGILYNALRTAGGSYEVSAWHDRLSGILSLCSYRDPDPPRTLRFLENLPDRFAETPLSEEDVRLAVISSFAQIEKPLSHRTLVRHAMVRGLTGLRRGDFSAFRRSLLSVDSTSIRDRFPGILEACLSNGGAAAFVPRWMDPCTVFPGRDSIAVLPRRNGNGRNR